MATIAYQGVEGAYSYVTATLAFGLQNTFIGTKDFSTLFEKVTSKEAQFGVVPLENSLAGSVVENFDLLYKNEVYITAERYLRIEHQLLSVESQIADIETRMQEIKKVFSHPKALEQCVNFFKKYPHIQRVPYEDTAGAAQFVAHEKNPQYGTIASKQAAQLYGLAILLPNIEDNPSNWTRFIIISPNKTDITTIESTGTYKCSLMYTLQNRPGTLYSILGYFAKEHINLTKIESRPIQGTQFEHFFYIDCEFDAQQYDVLKGVLKRLEQQADNLKVLGYYKKHAI